MIYLALKSKFNTIVNVINGIQITMACKIMDQKRTWNTRSDINLLLQNFLISGSTDEYFYQTKFSCLS